jgi:hypothetical protein
MGGCRSQQRAVPGVSQGQVEALDAGGADDRSMILDD